MADLVLTFPTIIPNFVQDFTLPDYGVQIFAMDDGSEVRTRTHATGHHTKLVFKYEGRNATEVANFLNFYKATKGLYTPFYLPEGLIQHPVLWKAALTAVLDGVDKWRFSAPPVINTVYTNIYNFDINIISVTE